MVDLNPIEFCKSTRLSSLLQEQTAFGFVVSELTGVARRKAHLTISPKLKNALVKISNNEQKAIADLLLAFQLKASLAK